MPWAPLGLWLIDLLSQVLLHLAKGLFEDTTKLEVVINKMMQQSMELIPCECCAVLLLDTDGKKDVSLGREGGGAGEELLEFALANDDNLQLNSL